LRVPFSEFPLRVNAKQSGEALAENPTLDAGD
jgi:hypothetical protein